MRGCVWPWLIQFKTMEPPRHEGHQAILFNSSLIPVLALRDMELKATAWCSLCLGGSPSSAEVERLQVLLPRRRAAGREFDDRGLRPVDGAEAGHRVFGEAEELEAAEARFAGGVVGGGVLRESRDVCVDRLLAHLRLGRVDQVH